nr:hypothetical protein Q903MT_gene5404 [Picea sitchensis]
MGGLILPHRRGSTLWALPVRDSISWHRALDCPTAIIRLERNKTKSAFCFFIPFLKLLTSILVGRGLIILLLKSINQARFAPPPEHACLSLSIPSVRPKDHPSHKITGHRSNQSRQLGI